MPMKQTDGTGAKLQDGVMYYVQEARGCVGNCALWWGIDSCGYTTELDRAGLYSADKVKSMRETDVPWPQQYVLDHVVRHVRVDDLSRKDDQRPVLERMRQRRLAGPRGKLP